MKQKTHTHYALVSKKNRITIRETVVSTARRNIRLNNFTNEKRKNTLKRIIFSAPFNSFSFFPSAATHFENNTQMITLHPKNEHTEVIQNSAALLFVTQKPNSEKRYLIYAWNKNVASKQRTIQIFTVRSYPFDILCNTLTNQHLR